MPNEDKKISVEFSAQEVYDLYWAGIVFNELIPLDGKGGLHNLKYIKAMKIFNKLISKVEPVLDEGE